MVDPRTPVVVGVGQFTERIDDPSLPGIVSGGLSPKDGRTLRPFSKVAAKNPFSSSPVERSVDEILTVTDDNRMICDPYPACSSHASGQPGRNGGRDVGRGGPSTR